ncbi:MAG: phage holin family protein [Candidatus Doudnabacteria bacterium]|nr:phage holin family protein [Candidatus Doudnabacteria bacterium]
MKIIFRILFTALGVLLAASVVRGISVSGFWTAILVAVVLGILNVTVGPLLKLLTLPLSIVTFGFFLLVINALMFWAASFVKGFHVEGFWAAFFGSLIVTVVSIIGRRLIRAPGANRY